MGCCSENKTEKGSCCGEGKECPCGAYKNVGKVDRILRVVIGLALISLVYTGPMTPWGWIGVVPLATGLLGWCGAYTLLGINTCGAKKCCKTEGGDKAEGSCCGGGSKET